MSDICPAFVLQSRVGLPALLISELIFSHKCYGDAQTAGEIRYFPIVFKFAHFCLKYSLWKAKLLKEFANEG